MQERRNYPVHICPRNEDIYGIFTNSLESEVFDRISKTAVDFI